MKKKKEKSEKKADFKEECCEKYLKKGEEKRCKRCPCFDLKEVQRLKRFKNIELDIENKF